MPKTVVIRPLLMIAALFWSFVPAAFALSGSFEAPVVYVSDADTIVVKHAGKNVRVRLANIDAPEKTQPWGLEGKAALAQVLRNSTVRVLVHDTDQYGRPIGEIFLSGHNVNRWLVEKGYVYVYGRYNVDPVILELERQARQNRLGVWGLPDTEREMPWDYRRRMRGQ